MVHMWEHSIKLFTASLASPATIVWAQMRQMPPANARLASSVQEVQSPTISRVECISMLERRHLAITPQKARLS